MKLLEPNAAIISNCELLHVLAGRGADGSGKALTVERMAYQYLTAQPVRPLGTEQLRDFFAVLQPYNLSRGEMLQLANLAPRTAVEVHLAVPDCDARLGEEGVEAVLAAVAERLAREEGEGEEGAGAEDAGADGMGG
ncbi:hypothetical protein GPECTOR_13g611 [Gonium pectorale]|uniref:DNA-directed RNA polymerase III subunit RPC9 n=1 Tax=Gonium pectorale TaxID=33097 RepID=A0A150GMU9_GONPE|nr:hypothetical protein GPECTOR_13g611 [Gonium pectorale]|eukprot:KXZ51124.1 hypothetical protein GPECTOR_13g611 [Gonium pectorale]